MRFLPTALLKVTSELSYQAAYDQYLRTASGVEYLTRHGAHDSEKRVVVGFGLSGPTIRSDSPEWLYPNLSRPGDLLLLYFPAFDRNPNHGDMPAVQRVDVAVHLLLDRTQPLGEAKQTSLEVAIFRKCLIPGHALHWPGRKKLTDSEGEQVSVLRNCLHPEHASCFHITQRYPFKILPQPNVAAPRPDLQYTSEFTLDAKHPVLQNAQSGDMLGIWLVSTSDVPEVGVKGIMAGLLWEPWSRSQVNTLILGSSTGVILTSFIESAPCFPHIQECHILGV
jgi:hypothetical protein